MKHPASVPRIQLLVFPNGILVHINRQEGTIRAVHYDKDGELAWACLDTVSGTVTHGYRVPVYTINVIKYQRQMAKRLRLAGKCSYLLSRNLKLLSKYQVIISKTVGKAWNCQELKVYCNMPLKRRKDRPNPTKMDDSKLSEEDGPDLMGEFINIWLEKDFFPDDERVEKLYQEFFYPNTCFNITLN